MELEGLHHVTAVTGHAQANIDFYTDVLGMRLVKKTVNQDDVAAYHLYYADAEGHAGTDMTFFDWPQIGPNVDGTGTVAATALRVPSEAALQWWVQRFDERQVAHEAVTERGGRATLPFTDPEGQQLWLVEDGGARGGTPWQNSDVPVEMAIRGLHAVLIRVRRLQSTARVLTEVLGFQEAGEYTQGEGGKRVVVFAAAEGGPGTEVHVEERPELSFGRVGIGGVHHVAFRTPNEQTQRQWRARIAGAGLGVTEIIDRFYFKSIYFREPGGVLFEVATDGPGFATDEDLGHLGESLALPPFLEPNRQQIEAGLKPIGLHSKG